MYPFKQREVDNTFQLVLHSNFKLVRIPATSDEEPDDDNKVNPWQRAGVKRRNLQQAILCDLKQHI